MPIGGSIRINHFANRGRGTPKTMPNSRNKSMSDKYAGTLWQTNSLLLKMAIEIVDLPIKNGGSFHSCVSLPEGTWRYPTSTRNRGGAEAVIQRCGASLVWRIHLILGSCAWPEIVQTPVPDAAVLRRILENQTFHPRVSCNMIYYIYSIYCVLYIYVYYIYMYCVHIQCVYIYKIIYILYSYIYIHTLYNLTYSWSCSVWVWVTLGCISEIDQVTLKYKTSRFWWLIYLTHTVPKFQILSDLWLNPHWLHIKSPWLSDFGGPFHGPWNSLPSQHFIHLVQVWWEVDSLHLPGYSPGTKMRPQGPTPRWEKSPLQWLQDSKHG